MADTPLPSERLPGCGFGAYALVLGLIFSAGVCGLGVSSYVIWESGAAASPLNLMYGGSAEPLLLAPMRVAGLLGETEIPDAFHAERIDGSAGCAVAHGALLRLDAEGEKTELPLAELTKVDYTETEVTATGPKGTITCYFNAGEGADRLGRMLQAP